MRNGIWDSLIAVYLCPAVDPRDRADLVQALRTLQVVQTLDKITAAELRELSRATAAIPLWVRDKQAGTPTPDVTPAPTPRPTPAPGPRPGVDLVRVKKDYQAATAASADLAAAQSKARRSAERRNAKPAPLGIPSADGTAGFLTQAEGRAGQLSPAAVTALKPETRKTLDALAPGWQSQPYQETQSALTARASAAHQQYARTAGLDLVRDVETLAPDITLPPATPIFERSIEGSVGAVKPIGYGDLLVVQEEVICYREGEISHIENVMKTEKMERVFRKLDRTTQTTFTSTEETQSTERDLQSTERFEVASQAQENVNTAVSVATGVSVSTYGPLVEVQTDADFAVSSSKETSQTNSTNFAQESVENTVSKVTQTIRQELTQTVLAETEETNTHTFDNVAGTGHVSGIYRWVDKVYQARVWNYGKRLMLEFIIPEPSAFYKYALESRIPEGLTVKPPEPLPADFSFTSLTPSGYKTWVNAYQVPNVAPPPPEELVVTAVMEQTEVDKSNLKVVTKTGSLQIPDGYVAESANASSAYYTTKANDHFLGLLLGRECLTVSNGDNSDGLHGESGTMNMAVYAREITGYVIAVEVLCSRTAEHLTKWQLETYDKIVAAYNAAKSAYDQALASQKNVSTASVSGLAPEVKRGIEARELKRGCLELLTNQYFHDFDATTGKAQPYGYPEFRVPEAMKEGPYVQFFEQLCEWEQMTYVFYPYYWGRKAKWVANSTASDPDPTFEAFLQAGSARALAPVRPEYERACVYYLETGEIWNGGETPVLDTELYVSIVDEIAEGQGMSMDNPEPYGEPWQYTIPTSLVKLQADSALPCREGARGGAAAS